jgi:hypothetical protein
MEIINLLSSFITILPELAVVSLCVYYYSQRKSVDGLLMCIGSGLGLLISGFYRLLPVINSDFYLNFTNQSLWFTIASVIGFVGSVCFAIGLGMLLLEKINKRA